MDPNHARYQLRYTPNYSFNTAMVLANNPAHNAHEYNYSLPDSHYIIIINVAVVKQNLLHMPRHTAI